MKIRNHRKREYYFYPHDKGKTQVFKYKKELLNFLNSKPDLAINGIVGLNETCFGSSSTLREWFVWYNDYKYKTTKQRFKIVLIPQLFRGRKYIFKKHKVNKSSKKYFAHSKKRIHLMCEIAENGITEQKAKKLLEIFTKSGFKDFNPSEEDLYYINGHIGDGIDFFHWSDRCNHLRMKTVIEYFKREKLL